MKKTLIAMLVVGGAGLLPAQFDCNPSSTYYSGTFPCLVLRSGQNRVQELQMLINIADGKRREWAAIEASYPPVIVASQPGQRIAPRRKAQQFSGEEAKRVEASAEASLSQFEEGVRAQPHVLLDLPHTHLATAYTLLTLRCYMALRGLDDISPESVRNTYWRFRQANRSPEAAKVVDNPQEVQALYETLLLMTLEFDTDWQSARMRGDRGAIENLRKRAQEGLDAVLGKNSAEWIRGLDSDDRLDRDMRSTRYALKTPVWGYRTTLRVTLPPGTGRQPAVPGSEGFDPAKLHPPLVVTTAPGRRLWPREFVKATASKTGSNRELEAMLNQALDIAERELASRPSSLPQNHLATMMAREAEILFAIIFGYRSTSEEVPRKIYEICRIAHAAPGYAERLAPQLRYENSMYRWLEFLNSYSQVLASRNPRALEALQKRARQAMEDVFGASTGDLLVALDQADRQARTGRPKFNIGMRLFDFRDGEKFEYELHSDSLPKGELLIAADRLPGGQLRVTIHAKLGTISLDREVRYSTAFGLQDLTAERWADTGFARQVAGLLFTPDETPAGQTDCTGASSEFAGRVRRLKNASTQCVNSELPLPILADSSGPDGRIGAKLLRYNPPSAAAAR
ncbi:MAG: hypothetical protein HY820_43735 [Acidobacteria bacterium]|nr:hypothetical protein [Acidobacteriota bacterium]